MRHYNPTTMTTLDSAVLVLNSHFLAISLTSVRRAFCLMSKGHARAVGSDYRPYTMAEWLELEPDVEGVVTTSKQQLAVPRVIVVDFDRLPRREVKFSRRNVYLRDGFSCGFCGRAGRHDELNLDHVLPVSRGGKSCWENVVTSCIKCNTKKGDRTPAEAGMELLRLPTRPRWQVFLGVVARGTFHDSWKAFLPASVVARA